MRARTPHGIRRGQPGFTLVELMIAMVITGIFAVVAYAMFDNTSSMLKEVDELSDVQDRMRFALERLRGDLQMAGALTTPDSDQDPWVQPKPNDSSIFKEATKQWRVAAIIPYVGWQDATTGYSSAIKTANTSGGSLPFSHDGIVIMGAIDFPLPFEASGFIRGGADKAGGAAGAEEAVIRPHQRGVERLHAMDPFRTGMGYAPGQPAGWMKPRFETRLFRVRDRQGYMQFADLKPYPSSPPDPTSVPLLFNKDSHPPYFKTESSDANGKMQVVGLDDGEEGMADAGYDAAFIDAYWYHVRVDASDETNSQLVRTRLCAPLVAKMLQNDGVDAFDPSAATNEKCSTNRTREDVVIADHVVDFQIWFDCADSTGAVKATAWGMGWKTPDASAASMSCLKASTYQPGAVRMGHVRLSLRAGTERADVTNYLFEKADGVHDLAGAGQSLLRTFNIVGPLNDGSGDPAPGAAAVVTMQTDFELPNLAASNQLGTVAGGGNQP